MSEIVDFLNQQYERIEERARAAMHGGRGVWTHIDPIRHTGAIMDDCGETVVYDEGSPTGEQAEHIVANDPAYAIADIASKRRIVERERWHPHGDLECGGHPGPYMPHGDYGPGYCRRIDEENPTLLDLAAPFSAEPGYKQEWFV